MDIDKIKALALAIPKTDSFVGAKAALDAFHAEAYPAAVLELIAEVERLRAEVKEWLCIDCNTAYPGPPQLGFACVTCPKCKGTTMPRQSAEIKKLRTEYAELREASITLSAEVSRLQGAAPAAGTEKDTTRLDFMIEQECQIEHMDRPGAAPLYRVRWPWTYAQQNEWSESGREAIDAAIASSKEKA